MKNKEILFFVLIILLAIVSRFLLLDLRVLHHDEGVNYFFAESILEGKGFAYNPLNYHGPFYFFALALSFLIFGIGEFGLRFPAAVFGALIVLAPLFFKILKWKERVIISVFLLLSPSLLYYSRYSIHEGAFVFFSLMSVYFFSLILEKGNLRYLPWLAASLGFLFVIKETAIIMLFILFLLGGVNFKRFREIKFKGNGRIVLISISIFALIYILFFTSFFSNISGIGDSFRAFTQWTDRGLNEKGHDKAFYYYFLLLGEYEWPILLFALMGVFYIGKYRNRIFDLNLAIWFVLIFLIYSFIPYKTPWLVINISVPMCLVAGIGFWNFNFWKGKLKWILLIMGILYLGSMAIYLNFVNSWGEGNKFAYVHTDKEVLRLVGEINEVYNVGDKILIVSDEYWPLPFYLHGKDVNYLGEEGFGNFSIDESWGKDYDIFILRDKIFKAGDWAAGEYKYEEGFRLREGVEYVLGWKGG